MSHSISTGLGPEPPAVWRIPATSACTRLPWSVDDDLAFGDLASRSEVDPRRRAAGRSRRPGAQPLATTVVATLGEGDGEDCWHDPAAHMPAVQARQRGVKNFRARRCGRSAQWSGRPTGFSTSHPGAAGAVSRAALCRHDGERRVSEAAGAGQPHAPPRNAVAAAGCGHEQAWIITTHRMRCARPAAAKPVQVRQGQTGSQARHEADATAIALRAADGSALRAAIPAAQRRRRRRRREDSPGECTSAKRPAQVALPRLA